MKWSFRLRGWFVFKARCQLPWRSCGLRATCNFLKDYEIEICLVSWSKWSNKQHSLLFKASPSLIISETSPLAAACVGFYVLFQYRHCTPNIAYAWNDKAPQCSWGKLSHRKTSSCGTRRWSRDKTTLPLPWPRMAVTRLSGSSAIKLGNMPHFLPDFENILC